MPKLAPLIVVPGTLNTGVVLEQGEVKVFGLVLANSRVRPGQISGGEVRWLRERRGIKPLVNAFPAGKDRIPYDVGMLAASKGVAVIRGGDENERLAGSKRENSIGLPSAQHGIHQAVPSVAETSCLFQMATPLRRSR